MPELRKDPSTERWVIIDDREVSALFSFSPVKLEKTDSCPFCPGHESEIPGMILEYSTGGNWQVRVVPNRYPALRIEGDLDSHGIGMFDLMNGVGAHEVLIESREHNSGFPEMTPEQSASVIKAMLERYRDLSRDKRFRFIMIFKNFGKTAGASLEHPHSQIIATPIIPKRVSEEIEIAAEYYDYHERCLYCDMIRQEIKSGRVVMENREFIVFCPFAARFPYEMWILPKQHQSSFSLISDSDVPFLSEILRNSLKSLALCLNFPSYNFIIHTSPCNPTRKNADICNDSYHWHIEIMPRLTHIAGFEWGSGFYVNHKTPETAAEELRSVSG